MLMIEKQKRREFLALIIFSRSVHSMMNLLDSNTNYIKKFYLGELLFFTLQCVFLKYLYAFEWEMVPKSVAKVYKTYSLQKPNDLIIKELIWRPMLDKHLQAHPKAL
uniref:Uncharacterized protein n=1 Tax=Euplotes harpa TaxID=151035 RepID=A0A7S3NA30_9SPIT|mmetsp:Transcript_28975/g.33082  ORF Transcript_28975/g.33082 Transcript_28975/m.33082 type:complete len:107 (+) Transcript_28975:548-868(+)